VDVSRNFLRGHGSVDSKAAGVSVSDEVGYATSHPKRADECAEFEILDSLRSVRKSSDSEMTPNLIFDAHLDLAWNAIEFNRDLRQPLERIRHREAGSPEKGAGCNTVCFPEMRRGRVGLCVATQLARVVPDFGRAGGVGRLVGFASQEQAWASSQGQLAWYREMEATGDLVQIRDYRGLDAHVRKWLEPANSSSPARPLPIGYILSLENADSIVSMRHLEKAYGDGLRAIGPVHYGPGIYGHGTHSSGPLTIRGHELLKEMERLGMILDATHLCDESFWDAMGRYNGPVWASHSNCRVVANWNRQFDDSQIRELIRRGAVIGMALDAAMMVHRWVLGRSTPAQFGLELEKIGEHIDHICQLAGNSRHVGIGSDLDGGFGTEQVPLDLESIADLTKLGKIFVRRGYRAEDIDGIFFGNFVALLKRCWT
jgi:membrane dipeptidase